MKSKKIVAFFLAVMLCRPALCVDEPEKAEKKSTVFDELRELQKKQKKKDFSEKLQDALKIAEKALYFTFLGTSTYLLFKWARSLPKGQRSSPLAPTDVVVSHKDGPITLADYIGEVPEEIKKIAHFYKNPPKKFNVSLGDGILLYGPPGTGKTFLAKALAGELASKHKNALFFHKNATEFCEKYVGSGEESIRNFFKSVSDASLAHDAPAIIFIDEIDAIGKKRNRHSEEKGNPGLLIELLNQLDGFKNNKNIYVIAATNRRDDLDEALIRPGRLGREVHVGLPNKACRLQLFEYYLNHHKPYASTLSLEELSEYILSPAAIQSTVLRAAENAAVADALAITQDHIMHVLTAMRAEKEPDPANTAQTEQALLQSGSADAHTVLASQLLQRMNVSCMSAENLKQEFSPEQIAHILITAGAPTTERNQSHSFQQPWLLQLLTRSLRYLIGNQNT